ncbi:MAG TPA: hypothetical protein VGV67_01760, partial [Solirubrobacteraceae bacterium]|nr:hypothetical protein [Solirubrobacteraceae bacterium]
MTIMKRIAVLLSLLALVVLGLTPSLAFAKGTRGNDGERGRSGEHRQDARDDGAGEAKTTQARDNDGDADNEGGEPVTEDTDDDGVDEDVADEGDNLH